MKNKRIWLEPNSTTESYITVTVENEQHYSHIAISLADCARKISWGFDLRSKTDLRQAKAKITRIKKLIDEVHAYIHAQEAKK